MIVDTGGLEVDPQDPIEARVQDQARIAIAEADVIVFVVEAIAGLTPADQEAAELLRRAKAPVLVAVNKSDNPKRELEAAEFYALGWEQTYPIAAIHGRGVADLLDEVVAALPAGVRGGARAQAARDARPRRSRATSRRAGSRRTSSGTRPTPTARLRRRGRRGDRRRRSRRPRDAGTRSSPASRTTSRRRSRWSAARTSGSRACSTRCSGRTG